jgi:hypothetical protein
MDLPDYLGSQMKGKVEDVEDVKIIEE